MSSFESGSEVLEQLRVRLAERRSEGAIFEVAWDSSLRAALRGVEDRLEKRNWRDALEATAHVWQDAYENRPVARTVEVVGELERATL